MAEKYIPLAHDAGLKVNGTVSTIWGCPIEGPTKMEKAIEFTKRWLDIGANDVEHADHDGSASPTGFTATIRCCSTAFRGPKNTLCISIPPVAGIGQCTAPALQAGMTNYESTLGGIGGQPANFVDGVPVAGTGAYYYKDSSITGLVSTEDMVVMMDEMGIETNLDIDRILETGNMVERIVTRLDGIN